MRVWELLFEREGKGVKMLFKCRRKLVGVGRRKDGKEAE